MFDQVNGLMSIKDFFQKH